MKVPKTLKNFMGCICIKCPTHNMCMKVKLQKVFCSAGKTNCELLETGCICGKCPIALKYDLKGTYYCEKGMEK